MTAMEIYDKNVSALDVIFSAVNLVNAPSAESIYELDKFMCVLLLGLGELNCVDAVIGVKYVFTDGVFVISPF